MAFPGGGCRALGPHGAGDSGQRAPWRRHPLSRSPADPVPVWDHVPGCPAFESAWQWHSTPPSPPVGAGAAPWQATPLAPAASLRAPCLPEPRHTASLPRFRCHRSPEEARALRPRCCVCTPGPCTAARARGVAAPSHRGGSLSAVVSCRPAPRDGAQGPRAWAVPGAGDPMGLAADSNTSSPGDTRCVTALCPFRKHTSLRVPTRTV